MTTDHNRLLNDLLQLHYQQFLELVMSPNDEEVLIVFGNSDVPKDHSSYDELTRSIWKLHLSSNQYLQLTKPEDDASKPTWSPDGKKIAFLSQRSGQKELWIMDRSGANQEQLTTSAYKGRDPYNGTRLLWSPDGNCIACTVMPSGSKYGISRKSQERFQNPKQMLVYQGMDHLRKQVEEDVSQFTSAVCCINVTTKEIKEVISNKGTAFHLLQWDAAGEALYFTRGKELGKISSNSGQFESLFIGRMESIKITGDDIWLAHRIVNGIEIGLLKNGQYSTHRTFEELGYYIQIHSWSKDGNLLFFTAQTGVTNALYAIDILSSRVNRLSPMQHVVWSPEHRAGVKCFNHADKIIFPLGNPNSSTELIVTDFNGNQISQSEFGKNIIDTQIKVEIVKYSSENWEIESFLVLPPNYDKNKKYATLIYLHGGPESGTVTASQTPIISARGQSAAYYLASHNYVVFMPNYRGSGGYSDSFQQEVKGNQLMAKPYQDVVAGITYLINEGIADPDLLGIYGSSFGGMLTSWIVSQTSRFKGAAAALGIYDLLYDDRYSGRGSYGDMWMKSEFYKEISPIEQVHKMNTPMLLVETSAERRLYGSTATPFINGLKARNIESCLIYYPEANHNGGWNDHYKKDYMMRLLSWFDYCIRGKTLPNWFY